MDNKAKKPYLDMAKRIKLARKDLNMSQNEVAKKLKWTVSRYGMYELGERSPKAADMELMAKVLGKTPGFLMFGEKTDIKSCGDFDADLLIQCSELISEYINNENVNMSKKQEAQLIAFCYQHSTSEGAMPKKSTISHLFSAFCS